MWIAAGLLTLLGTLLYLFYRQRKQKHTLFRSLGIPGPEPHWLYGNSHELIDDRFVQLRAWTERYGKTFGYYEGPIPVLYTADLDILKQVLVKDFGKFHGRKPMAVQPDPDSPEGHMFFANGEKWRRLRSIISPTFSSGKLKQMFPLVVKKANILHDKFLEAAETDKAVDVHKIFQGYTLDVIGEVAFGMEVDSQNNPDEPYLVNCKALFRMISKGQRMISIAVYLPAMGQMLFALFEKTGGFMNGPANWLKDNVGALLEMRKAQGGKRMDMMQLMMDAEVDIADNHQSLTMTADDDHVTDVPAAAPSVRNAVKQKLNTEEIKAQGILFLLAGFETTSNALAYVTYLLATNPDKLELLHAELDANLTPKGPVTFEDLKELAYLDMCISEALRMYPIGATIVDRQCSEACMVGNIAFQPGMCVAANMTHIHNDPELWGPTDPELFCPERFKPEQKARRHPQAWMPFGGGPRNCIGMRFSLVETRLALALLLRDFTVEQCEETEVPLQLLWSATLTPKNGVKVKVVRREI